MLRKILLGIGLVLAALVILEIVALLAMKNSVSRYATYWKARVAEPGEFTYVALGDSAAQGIGATSPDNGYVGLIAQRIAVETGKPVRVINLSTSGAKLNDVLQTQLPQLHKHDANHVDLVTMEIGANNLQTYDAAAFHTEFEQILRSLPPDKSVVSTMPYFGGRIRVHGNDKAASDTITALAGQYRITTAPLYTTLRDRNSPRIYAADYFHPGNHGHRVWFDAFWQAIEPRLKK